MMEAGLEQAGQRIETKAEGCRVVWRSFGEGRPLVLLHGGHGSWRHWARNIPVLASSRRVLVPDMPGFGESDDCPHADLPGIVGVLADSLAQLRLDTPAIDLVGFSFGGLVAANLATHPSLGGLRVERLALLGPGGHAGPRRMQYTLINWRRASNATELAEAMHHNLRVFMIADPHAIDAQALDIHTRSCRATRFHSKSLSQAGGLQQAVARYAGPVLMIWGEEDVTVSPESIPGIVEACRPYRDVPRDWDIQVRMVDGAGHWVQYEAHHRVNAMLAEWLAMGQG